MKETRSLPQTIDEYVAGFPPAVRETLEKIRQTIRAEAPGALEAVKYGLPTFVLEGNLVHFGAFKNHIGFYPAPTGLLEFERELAGYERSKGAVRFPLDRPVPYELIRAIVRFRVRENLERAAARRKRK